jgi:hypothetical protein
MQVGNILWRSHTKVYVEHASGMHALLEDEPPWARGLVILALRQLHH